MLKRSFRAIVVAAMLAAPVVVTPTVFAQTQPVTAPATNTAPATELRVVARQLLGKLVSASVDDGKTWKPVAVGDTFGPGTIFRTGPRSAITCTVGDDQMFTLESLSQMRVEEAMRRGDAEKVDVHIKYGAASYGIERAGKEYDSTMRSPGATMSIGGTVVRIVNRPGFPPLAESFTGRALFKTARGSTFLGGRSIASSVQGTAAETALANGTVDPSIAGARTASESAVISQQLSAGGVLGFDDRANIPVVRGGGPLPDSALPNALPGRLSFALRWDGNADLNFIVDNQAGNQDNIINSGFRPQEILFPGYGLNVSLSGGQIPFDHRGGKTGGTEIAYWQNSFPQGVYGVGVLHASGATTDFKINAFLDGQPLPIIVADAEFNLFKVNTFKGTIGSGGGDGAILFVPRNPGFEDLVDPGPDFIAQQAIARAIAAKNRAGTSVSAKPALTSKATVTPPPGVTVPKVNKTGKLGEKANRKGK